MFLSRALLALATGTVTHGFMQGNVGSNIQPREPYEPPLGYDCYASQFALNFLVADDPPSPYSGSYVNLTAGFAPTTGDLGFRMTAGASFDTKTPFRGGNPNVDMQDLLSNYGSSGYTQATVDNTTTVAASGKGNFLWYDNGDTVTRLVAPPGQRDLTCGPLGSGLALTCNLNPGFTFATCGDSTIVEAAAGTPGCTPLSMIIHCQLTRIECARLQFEGYGCGEAGAAGAAAAEEGAAAAAGGAGGAM